MHVLMWVNLCPVIYLQVVNPSGVRHGWPALRPGSEGPHTVTVPHSLHTPLCRSCFHDEKERSNPHLHMGTETTRPRLFFFSPQFY